MNEISSQNLNKDTKDETYLRFGTYNHTPSMDYKYIKDTFKLVTFENASHNKNEVMETRKKVNSIIDTYIKNEIVATENGAFAKTINKWITEERKKEKLNDCTAKSLNALENLISSIPNRYPEEIRKNIDFFEKQEQEHIKNLRNKSSLLAIHHIKNKSR